MANSLKAKIQKLQYEGRISTEECEDILKKIDGHDQYLVTRTVDNFCNKATLAIEMRMLPRGKDDCYDQKCNLCPFRDSCNNADRGPKLLALNNLIPEIKDIAALIKVNYTYDDDIRQQLIDIEDVKEELEAFSATDKTFNVLDNMYPLLRELQKLRNERIQKMEGKEDA